MSGLKPTEDQKQFADKIADKLWNRLRKKGLYTTRADDFVREMIIHLLAKEGWHKNSDDFVKSAV